MTAALVVGWRNVGIAAAVALIAGGVVLDRLLGEAGAPPAAGGASGGAVGTGSYTRAAMLCDLRFYFMCRR